MEKHFIEAFHLRLHIPQLSWHHPLDEEKNGSLSGRDVEMPFNHPADEEERARRPAETEHMSGWRGPRECPEFHYDLFSGTNSGYKLIHYRRCSPGPVIAF